MTPKFKLGELVLTADGLTGEVVGIHINTFVNDERNAIMYTLKNLTPPTIGNPLRLPNVSRDERELSPHHGETTYGFTITMSSTRGRDRSVPANDAYAFLLRLEQLCTEYPGYTFKCENPLKLTPAQPTTVPRSIFDVRNLLG